MDEAGINNCLSNFNIKKDCTGCCLPTRKHLITSLTVHRYQYMHTLGVLRLDGYHSHISNNPAVSLTAKIYLVWPAGPLSPSPDCFEFYSQINLSILKRRGGVGLAGQAKIYYHTNNHPSIHIYEARRGHQWQ
jgi:hypothetical protein